MIPVASNLSLPDEAVTEVLAFIARRKAGKTYGSMKVAEGMLQIGAQIVAFDPVGVWYSLRLKPNGKDRAFDIPIFGGLHGDIPLRASVGALVAELLVERNSSAILDVSMFTQGERREFATAFAERFLQLKKSHRSPVHTFIEEAELFIPQRVFKGEERMLGAFERFAKQGRNFGIGMTLIGQRPQSINKEVLNQCEALFAMQIAGSQERKALREWVIEHGIETKSIVDELPGLQAGEAYLWSPSWLRKLVKIKISERSTYNASATPTGQAANATPQPLTKTDLAQLEQAMIETVELAKANDPADLRKQIADLKRQLDAKPLARVERVEVPVLPDSALTELRECVKDAGAILDRFVGVTDQIHGALARLQQPKTAVVAPPQIRPAKIREKPAPSAGDGKALKAGARRMLQVLARYGGTLRKNQLATLADVNRGSGTFSEYVSTLRTNGFIADDSHTVTITNQGESFIGEPVRHEALAPEQIVAAFGPKLKAGARRMLDILVERYPDTLSKVELADLASVNRESGTFSEYLSTLRANGLVEDTRQHVNASATLFLGVMTA